MWNNLNFSHFQEYPPGDPTRIQGQSWVGIMSDPSACTGVVYDNAILYLNLTNANNKRRGAAGSATSTGRRAVDSVSSAGITS